MIDYRYNCKNRHSREKEKRDGRKVLEKCQEYQRETTSRNLKKVVHNKINSKEQPLKNFRDYKKNIKDKKEHYGRSSSRSLLRL